MRGALLGLLVALGGIAACTSPEERFADHMARGEGYADAGELENALLEFHSALKIRPDDADLNERIGDLLIERRAPRDAAFFYREAHRLDPGRSDAAIKEARALIRTDRRRARQLLEEVLERDADDAFALRTLARLALAEREVDKALETAERAVELAPGDPENWLQLGSARAARVRQAQLAGGADDELFLATLAAFDGAEQAAGGHVGARIDRGRVYASWPGHRQEAEQSFRDAIELARTGSDPVPMVNACRALAKAAQHWRDPDLERWVLRELLAATDEQLSAWQRLAALAGDPAQAGRIYSELLAARPKDPNAHALYVNFLTANDRGDAATAHIEEALEDGVQSPVLWEQLLRVHLARGRLPDARATLVRMADAYPEDPLTRRGRARIALATGRTDEAAELLREVVLEEESYESQRFLARAEHRLGNLERALAAVDRAVSQSPRFPLDALELKARIHHDAEQWRQSLATLDRIAATGLPPTSSQWVMRGVALYELGDREGGRRALLAALDRDDPRAGAAVEYARREGRANPKGARRYLEAAFERTPTNRVLLEELNAWDLREGRAEAALERLNQVIEKERVSPSILLVRADLLASRGDYDAAEADALRAFETAPGSPEALDQLFRLYVVQGKAEEATRSFDEAAEAGVLHEGAKLLLARLALHTGDVERARRTYEEVLAARPEMASAQSDLAFLLARQGEDWSRALSLAQQAREKMGKDPGIAHRLGYVYLRGDRHEDALRELRRASELAEPRRRSGLGPTLYYHMGLALRALERDGEAIDAFESALALDSEFPDAEDARRQIDSLRNGARS